MIRTILIVLAFPLASPAVWAQDSADRKAEYVHAVTRGGGLMPWQESGISVVEKTFREKMEARKDALLARGSTEHPVLLSPDHIETARRNIAETDWAKGWLANQRQMADYIVGQGPDWIAHMLPAEAPAHAYGFTCPNCVGDKSQEATGRSLFSWSYKNPDEISCRKCGQVYPDAMFPETAVLQLPRLGESITYYLNDAERAHPDDRSGKHSWYWVGHPIHVSFTGIIREQKIGFMRTAAKALAFSYLFTEDPRYAAAARDVLTRYAECYRQWPYRDYWDTYADCDPLYAAWHDKSLPLEWKRHLVEDAYARDTLEQGRMMQNYWGAGRVHPSTDSISGLHHLAVAYDLTYSAVDSNGDAVWGQDAKRLVERDLLLEYLMGAEPYVGGPGQATNANNKAPRIYNAMASVGKCLGIAEYMDTAIKGYEIVRDESFLFDGFSKESPAYTNMYLGTLLAVPETLHGFQWPEAYTPRSGTVNLYRTDTKLQLMYRQILDTVLPSGHYLPLSDTRINSRPSGHIVQMGVRRFPDLFEGVLPSLRASSSSEYALFNLSNDELKKDGGLRLTETYYPAWMTSIFRHGDVPNAATMTLAFNPAGGHRHYDNLALFYADHGQTILGDLGYVGDMPVNRWIKSTASHNLVVVDNAGQRHKERTTEFHMLVTSPLASVIDASSTAYKQCSEYRRRTIFIKGSPGRTFAIDIFTVEGGASHRYRVYSELASSDAGAGGSINFNGVSLPAERPLPQVGASLAEEDIYGLRDVRSGEPATADWQAVWREPDRAYRLWMFTDCERVEASNGPGQRSLEESGRRVRYVDAVREGEGLRSTYVAVHEPSDPEGDFVITNVERLDAAEAGPNAIALRIDSAWGEYLVLSRFDEKSTAGGTTFQGDFALIHRSAQKEPRHLLVGARVFGEKKMAPSWSGEVQKANDYTLSTQESISVAVPDAAGVKTYARVRTSAGWTGFPVDTIDNDVVQVERFPIPNADRAEVLSVVYKD